MSLLCLRFTPVDSPLQSSAELLYQCKLHSNLPIWVGNLITDKAKINQWLTQRQQQMMYYHDRSATDLSPLTAWQPVYILDQARKKWLPGPINCTRPKPHSYEVKTQSGSVLCPASTEMIVTEPKDEPSAVELHNVPEPIKTSHTLASSPLQDVIASQGTHSDSQSLGTCHTRSGHAVTRPAPFTE